MSVDVNEMATNGPFLSAMLVLAVRELWRLFKDRGKANTEALKENTKETSLLNISIVKLEVRLTAIDALVSQIPKMKEDINVLHERVRMLRPEFGK